ncbi:MAG TPA: CidA/LrgA family protein [Geothrix sp.]|nr:CidA/LrgA family protein [Geothrix sp.]
MNGSVEAPPPAPSEPSEAGDSRALTLHPGLRAFAQVLGLVALWWGSDQVVHGLHLPLPGSVLGLGLLVLLLRTGLLPLAWIKEGADWLLAEMLLFFIPAVVAVVQYPSVILRAGWQLLVVILVGTVGVMVGTALVVERVFRWERQLRLRQGGDPR